MYSFGVLSGILWCLLCGCLGVSVVSSFPGIEFLGFGILSCFCFSCVFVSLQ